MAEPTDSYPTEATNRARKERRNGDEPEALIEALAAHDDELAAAVESSDELNDLLTTAVIMAASADEEDVENLTDSTANLVKAADGLTTDETAALAQELGQSAGDLADLLTLASAFSSSLSSSEVERLSTTIEDSGSEVVDALETLVELQEEGQLEQLVALLEPLSALELDRDAVEGLNTLLAAAGEAQRESQSTGLLGAVKGIRSRDGRAGLGYVLALLKGVGRRGRL